MGSSASGPSAGQVQAKSNRPCLVQYPTRPHHEGLPPLPGPSGSLCPPSLLPRELPGEPASLFRVPRGPGPRGRRLATSGQRQRVVDRQAGRQRPVLSRARLGVPFDPGASERGFGPCCGPASPAEGGQFTAAPASLCCRRGEQPSSTQESSLRFTFFKNIDLCGRVVVSVVPGSFVVKQTL